MSFFGRDPFDDFDDFFYPFRGVPGWGYPSRGGRPQARRPPASREQAEELGPEEQPATSPRSPAPPRVSETVGGGRGRQSYGGGRGEDGDEGEGAWLTPFSSGFGSIGRHWAAMDCMFDDAFRRSREAWDEAARRWSERPVERGEEGKEGEGSRPWTRHYSSMSQETILPGGVREVRHSSRDTGTGKAHAMHIRQLGDRSVTTRAERDLGTGRETTTTQYMNVKEDGMPAFDDEWGQTGMSRRGIPLAGPSPKEIPRKPLK